MVQAINNLDMYIKGGGGQKNNKLIKVNFKAWAYNNDQYARRSSTYFLDWRYVGQHRIM